MARAVVTVAEVTVEADMAGAEEAAAVAAIVSDVRGRIVNTTTIKAAIPTASRSIAS